MRNVAGFSGRLHLAAAAAMAQRQGSGRVDMFACNCRISHFRSRQYHSLDTMQRSTSVSFCSEQKQRYAGAEAQGAPLLH